ncbi:MAG: helicase-related protein [Acutalibacteraceae bacterium]|nr:helicase-related protein [Acutalibacteraceae bacterium]
MDSKEILNQYIVGSMKSKSAIIELEKLIDNHSSLNAIQEAARARCVIGFIKRIIQYKCDKASKKDICLKIRDVVLYLGRIKLTDKLYSVVKECGTEFNLICENDNHVSCFLHTPDWLEPKKYIEDVYALKHSEFIELEETSVGDLILSTHTKFKTYKNFEQKIAVHTAINLPKGHTLLISQPTGGGKSLVTQMLASISKGITVVIVPTVALEQDQYQAAKYNLTNPDGVYRYLGKQTEEERKEIITALNNKKAKVLFTSPEAILKNTALHEILNNAAKDNYLCNVVVDEAHIVPDWGVFFRPDFQIFSILLRKWRKESQNHLRTYLLSATLSDNVVDTLFNLFGNEGCNAQVRCDALRQEPRFYFKSTKSFNEQDNKIIEAVKLLPKPMVVYVLEPREAKSLQKKLNQEGYMNIPIFTGESKNSERDVVLTGWKSQEFDVIIATSAFGIGVDKPDVRTIIHACCPENLSRFYQEVGRSGRDRLPSLSLFLPYQSSYDKDGDVHRARGLVNKRVLTVERAVIRWNCMLKNPVTFIDGDECILNTSTIPPTKSDEEVEFAGNLNVSWNVNLLLLLHRIGFIELIDASYILNKDVTPVQKYYSITAKILKPDILGDENKLNTALQIPREEEYNSQMEGYYIIKNLINSPKSKCWGRTFRHLFPLSNEVCNGCPADAEGRITLDEKYKLRLKPSIQLPRGVISKKLERYMGTFDQLVVKRNSNGSCTLEEVQTIVQKVISNGIGTIVVPNRFSNELIVNGLLLNYDEFYFAVVKCPYLFSKGVLCVFDSDTIENISLYKSLEKLNEFGYYKVLYCNDNIIVTNTKKPLSECLDCNIVDVDRL